MSRDIGQFSSQFLDQSCVQNVQCQTVDLRVNHMEETTKKPTRNACDC